MVDIIEIRGTRSQKNGRFTPSISGLEDHNDVTNLLNWGASMNLLTVCISRVINTIIMIDEYDIKRDRNNDRRT